MTHRKGSIILAVALAALLALTGFAFYSARSVKAVSVSYDQNTGAPHDVTTRTIKAKKDETIQRMLKDNGYAVDSDIYAYSVNLNKKVADISRVTITKKVKGTVTIGDKKIAFNSADKTVGAMLKGIDIKVGKDDIVKPGIKTALTTKVKNVDITRVTKATVKSQEVLPYQTKVVASNDVADGAAKIVTAGKTGTQQVTTEVTYENGKIVSQQETGREVVKAPTTAIIHASKSDADATEKAEAAKSAGTPTIIATTNNSNNTNNTKDNNNNNSKDTSKTEPSKTAEDKDNNKDATKPDTIKPADNTDKAADQNKADQNKADQNKADQNKDQNKDQSQPNQPATDQNKDQNKDQQGQNQNGNTGDNKTAAVQPVAQPVTQTDEKTVTTTQTVTEPIPYSTTVIYNVNKDNGTKTVISKGVEGQKEVTYQIVTKGNTQLSKTPLKTVVIKEPVAEIVSEGTKAPTTNTANTNNTANTANTANNTNNTNNNSNSNSNNSASQTVNTAKPQNTQATQQVVKTAVKTAAKPAAQQTTAQATATPATQTAAKPAAQQTTAQATATPATQTAAKPAAQQTTAQATATPATQTTAKPAAPAKPATTTTQAKPAVKTAAPAAKPAVNPYANLSSYGQAAVRAGQATTGHKTVKVNASDLDFICAIVAAEDNESYKGALAVISCIMNRVDAGSWGGSTPTAVIKAAGQFSTYSGGHYKKWQNNKYPAYVKAAVTDCLNGGVRNHNYKGFRANKWKTMPSVQIGGNWYAAV